VLPRQKAESFWSITLSGEGIGQLQIGSGNLAQVISLVARCLRFGAALYKYKTAIICCLARILTLRAKEEDGPQLLSRWSLWALYKNISKLDVEDKTLYSSHT
jgi:hypothetical protein